MIFQGFARRKISLSVSPRLRRRCGSAIATEPADDPRQGLDRAERTLGQPRARVPDVVGSRHPRPYHLRARIQSFQAVAAPFAGDSVLAVRPSRAAIPASEAASVRPARGTGSRKIEIPSAFCGFSRLCKAENFPSARHADILFRAIGAAPTGTTMPPTISRPDALSPRHMRASARRRPELVAAI